MPITKPVSVLDPERFDLSRLSPAETLWIWRHRQLAASGRKLGRAGPAMNQREAAETLGLEKRDYSRLEAGGTAQLSVAEISNMHKLMNVLGPINPPMTVSEYCLLARRRSGLGLRDVAIDGLGITRKRYLDIEKVGHPNVVNYWIGQGFRFPKLPNTNDERLALTG